MFYAPPLLPQQTPLQWWIAHESLYPHIFLLATRYLAIPATSAEYEQLFSLAKLFMTLFQTTKSPEILAEQVLLQRNFDLLDAFNQVEE